MKIAKYLRTPILKNIYKRLLCNLLASVLNKKEYAVVPKKGNVHDINCMAVLALHSIEKRRSAAEQVFSMLNLQLTTWYESSTKQSTKSIKLK